MKYNGECLLYVLVASVVPASRSIFRVDSIVGKVNCTGTETELVECSHETIGHGSCGGPPDDVDDVVIVCGMH